MFMAGSTQPPPKPSPVDDQEQRNDELETGEG